jgi:hypothetical protein
VTWYIGLDLGQQSNYTAMACLEQTWQASPRGAPEAHYACRYLARWRQVSYPEQVTQVATLLAAPELEDRALIVDQTGVGRAVFDMLKDAGLDPIGVSIHGGDTVTHQGAEYRVPKRDLVATVAVLLQARRLTISKALPLAATLTHELLNFRVTIDPRTAHDSYAAWREADHDDLVLAVALACWAGEQDIGAPLPNFTIPILYRPSPWGVPGQARYPVGWPGN